MRIYRIENCLKEGKAGGERHKGARKIQTNPDKAKNHLKKAIHNFNAITDFYNLGYSDWSASASFYSLYHCLLESSDRLLDLREKMQYSVKTTLEKNEFDALKGKTKELFDKLRLEIEEK